MKRSKILGIIFSVLLICCLSLVLVACGGNDDDNNGSGEIFYYSETADGYFLTRVLLNDKTEIVIPDTYNGKPVIGISNDAFISCSELTSITISKNVASIGGYTFNGCTNLGSISVDTENQTYKSDGNCLLSKDGTNLILGCKNSVIPDDVVTIGDSAFAGCSSLYSITLPDSVTTIGDSAFIWCSSLAEITISKNVTSIGDFAFSNCSSIERIVVDDQNQVYKSDGYCLLSKDGTKLILGCKNSVIPYSVTTIGDFAFADCTGLKSITIPDNVTSIGVGAFDNCSSLISIAIGYRVNTIKWSAFTDCSSLEIIIVHNLNQTYKSDGNCVLSKDGTEMIFGCKNSVIPNGVTTIGERAFSGCSGLTSVTIPNSVTTIAKYAFSSCSGLTSVTIPDSVTIIENNAFEVCNNLDNVTIGKSVVKIDEYAFNECSKLATINYTGDIASWCKISGLGWLIDYGKTNRKLFIDNKEITGELIIPDGVAEIGKNAFACRSSLTSITIPNSVTSIGYYAFYNCSAIKTINFKGTKAKWNAIVKDTHWNYNTGNFTIICTDGNLDKNGNEIA